MQKVQDVITDMHKKQQALTKKIQQHSGGKDEFYQAQAEVRKDLDIISAKMDALMDKKNELNTAMGNQRQEGIAMKDDLQKMKKSIGYSSEADIDHRIATIEFKLQTESMALKDEKKYLSELSELKKNRPKVAKVNKLEGDLTAFREGQSGGEMKATIQEINAAMAKHREEKKVHQEKLAKLRDERKAKLGDVPTWHEGRQKIGEEIQAKVQEKNALRDEFKVKEREYYAYLAEVRRDRQDKIQEERMAWQKDREQQNKLKKAERLEEQPYVAEITLIEQTIAFCNSLTQKKADDVKEEKKDIAHNNPEGTEVLVKKEDQDEFFMMPAKGKKSKSKKGGKAEGSAKPIKHNAETFRLFDQLKLDAPITTDEVPALLEKLEAQLADYQQKVKVWEETKEEQKRKILAGLEEEDQKDEANEEE